MKSLRPIAAIFVIAVFYANAYCATKPPTDIKDKLTTLKQSLGNLKTKLGTLSKKLKTLNRKLKSKTTEQLLKFDLTNKIEHLQKDSIVKTQHNKEELKQFAEGLAPSGKTSDGYGYKVANLRELEKIAQDINTYSAANKLSFNVIIPTFAAIPSSNIKIFLKDNGINLSTEWENLKKEMGKKEPDQTAAISKAFETKKFPDNFLQSLEKLEKTIKDKFTQISDSKQEQGAVQIFTKNFNNNEYNVAKIIQDIGSSNKRLMVRSTGKEDTQEVANAGGNESVANVEPTCKDVLKAMGVGKKDGQLGVVSSYFSKKSFSQRLGIGDQSLFSQEPLTPVLIQKMIGEKQGGETETNKIPRVGVMFTEEAEGGYKTPGKSTGITIIQAAYGHNEGVVNGLISVDTYYVTNDGKVYPIIRYKKDRLVPSVNGLEKISNPKEIQNVPTLDHHAVLNLKFVANALEKYYGYPMDVEFVYESETKTINIVQARPITYKKNLPDPSFLKNVSQYKNTTLNGITIGAAGGSLRFINGKNQIIVSENLGQALTTYIDSPNSKEVQCVITGEMAPATSHEATTFRGEGIPVIYVNDIQPVNNWIDSDKFKIVIDPQQEVLINWTSQTEDSLKILLNTDKVEKSWTNYPIPRQLSLINLSKETKKLKSIFTPKEIFEFLSDASKTEADMKQEYSQINNYKISELLQSIKQEIDKKKAKLSLARTVLQIHKKYSQIKKIKTLIDPSLLNLLDTIFDNVIKLARTVKTAIDKSEPTEPQRLFTIRLFEAVLKQDPDMGEVINGYSFAKILKITKQEKKIKKTKTELSKISIQLYKISDLAFTNEIKENWKSFVTEWQKVADPFEKDIKKSIKNKFAKLIITLGNLRLIPLWLHTSFATTYQLGKPKETGIALIEEFEAAETFINVLDEKMNTLNTFDVSGFEDPAKLEKSKNAFIKDILIYFKSDQFISDFKDTNNLGKLAGLKVMATLVDKFDLTIKTLKGSLKFDRKSIVLHEKLMLEEYFELLLQWISLLSFEQIKELSPLDSNELKNQSENDFRQIIFENLKQKKYFAIWKVGDWKKVTDEQLKTTPDLIKVIFIQYLSVIKRCIEKVDPSTLDELELKNHLFGSKDFNVSGFALGSKLQLSESTSPKVLEDAFTSIHQNLLVIISQLTATLGLGKIKAPTKIESFIELIKSKSIKVNLYAPNKKINTKFLFGVADARQIENMMNPQIPLMPKYTTYLENISIIGIDMDTNNLIYSYNMPLRGHSCFFKLIFNKNKNEAKLVAEFVFQNIDLRINGLESYLKGKKTNAPEITFKKGRGDKSVIYTSPIKLNVPYYKPEDLLEDLEILGNLTIFYLD